MDVGVIGTAVAEFIGDPFIMMLLGMLANFLQRLIEKGDSGEPISPWSYIKHNPYRIGISIIGLLVGYSILLQLGELTIMNALGLGYMSHSVVETFAGKFNASKLKPKNVKQKEE